MPCLVLLLTACLVRLLTAPPPHSSQWVLRAWLDVNASGCASWADESGNEALHYAVMVKDGEAMVQLLLERGACVNRRLPTGSTPLLIATLKDHHSVVMQLLRAGADPDIPDKDGHVSANPRRCLEPAATAALQLPPLAAAAALQPPPPCSDGIPTFASLLLDRRL